MKDFSLVLSTLALMALAVAPRTPAVAEEPKPLEPINLACNTADDEDEPHVASDGRSLFYASNPKGDWDIYVSTRAAVGQPWRKGQVVEDYLNSKDDEKSVFVTPESRYPQYMFAATRKTKDVPKPNFDIYVLVRQTPRAVFAAPTPLNTVDTEADEMHPWLTPDGRRLYFSRKDKDGWRVYSTSRQATTGAAGFMQPVLIKEIPAGFHHATLTPDGKTMYLQGPLEKERSGLFVSTLKGTTWSDPEALNINSADAPTGDFAPCLSRDGKLLYYASDRPGGKGKKDLWAIQTDQLKKAAR